MCLMSSQQLTTVCSDNKLNGFDDGALVTYYLAQSILAAMLTALFI